MNRGMVLVALLFSLQARGADWQLVAQLDASGSRVDIDTGSVAVAGEFKKAWFKWTYATPQKIPPQHRTDDNYTHFTSVKELGYFNCPERTSSSVQAIYSNEKGIVVGSFSTNAHFAQYNEVAPDTVGEIMFKTVCEPAQ